MSRRWISGWVAVLGAVIAATVATAQSEPPGRIGASAGLLGNGRMLHPFGRLTQVGNFPTGGALTPDGRFYWTVSAGRGIDDIQIVSVRSGAVTQKIVIPGASGGIAMDPKRSLAYVPGIAASDQRGDVPPAGTPGTAGDVIHVFRYDATSGRATFDHLIQVPPPSSASAPQNLDTISSPSPPKIAWPDRLAASPDGSRLLVPLNLADAVAIVDTASGSVAYVPTGRFPYGAAFSRDGRFGYVTNEVPGTVSVIDIAAHSKVSDVQVGGHLSHPEAITADPVANRVYVSVTNSDEVAVIDTGSQQLIRTLAAGRPEGLGTAPNALTVTPDGHRLLVAESGANELAVFALPGAAAGVPDYSMIGRIPTAEYPTAVAVTHVGQNPCATGASRTPAKTPAKHKRRKHKRKARHRASAHTAARKSPLARTGKHRARHRKRVTHRGPVSAPVPACSQLVYLTGKGLGTDPNPKGPQPNRPNDTDDRINETQYLPLLNLGAAAVGDMPSNAAIAASTATADAAVRPSNPQAAPADTPLRAGGPIKHVFYIVRENRTYDQILGDDPRGDGEPSLALFGAKATPNVHALVKRFPLIDHFYANSEASVDGHFWTSGANVSDYVHESWFDNYSHRGRPYDYIYAVSWPGNGFLIDQATSQGISYYNYGEAIGDVVPLPDKDRSTDENNRVTQIYANSDIGTGGVGPGAPGRSCYPNDGSVGQDAITKQPVFDSNPPATVGPNVESRFNCFQQHFQVQLAQGTVPAFNEIVLSNDHTRVLTPGAYTPTAMIADNDLGLGEMIQEITHSSIWSSSAIFITEDDSQDGADHVDAHRTVSLVISPYAKQGAVVHTRYDMLSMIRSMELILGMRPLYLTDALATPMYDAFTSTPSNSAPFDALPAQVDLLATNPAASSRARGASISYRGLDQLPQAQSDRLLWRSVHGPSSAPPPPGPNAQDYSAAGR